MLADRIARLTQRRWWLVLIGAALIARLAWAVALAPREPRFDERDYIFHARTLAEGKGYINQEGRRTAYWPVGYPLVLAICYRVVGDSLLTGVALQMILGVATTALISVIGSEFFGPRVGRSAALLVAIYPTHVFYATLHMTEPLFTLLFVISAALFLKGLVRGAAATAAAGFVIGLAALARGVILPLPFVLLIWYWHQKWSFWKILTRTTLAICFTLIAASPWLARNHGLTGSWHVTSTNGGHNFWIGNYPGAFGGPTAYRTEINEQLRTPVGSIPEEFFPDGSGWSPSQGYSLGLAAIGASPTRALRLAFQKVTYFFALETDGVLWNLKGLPQPSKLIAVVLLGIANAAYLFVLTFAILGLMGTPRTNPFASLFLVLTGYLVLVAVVFVGDPRYHYALVPLAAIFSAKGFIEDWPVLWKGMKENDSGVRRRLFRWAGIVVVFFMLMTANVVLKFLEFKAHLALPGTIPHSLGYDG